MPSSRHATAFQLLLALIAIPALSAGAYAQPPDEEEEPEPEPPRRPTTERTGPENPLGAAETGYSGALMLEMGTDVVIEGDVRPGATGDPDDFDVVMALDGNTLYAQASDAAGNSVSLLAEFYWFESSIDRASEFFVGVVTARTSPYSVGNWILERDVDPRLWYERIRPDRPPTLHVIARTDAMLDEGSFRWDWSLPFRNYGMDAYGTITMEQNYSIGLLGNGSAMAAYERTGECPGPEGEPIPGTMCEVKVDGQATGHFDTDYIVNTNYEITLHRWDVFTNLSATRLDWALYLRTPDRQWENATHQYYIAMQTGEGEAFRITELEARGAVVRKRDFWPDTHRELSVAIDNLVLSRPAGAGAIAPDDERRREVEDFSDEADPGADDDYDWPESDFDDEEMDAAAGGCAVSAVPPAGAAGWWLAALLGATICRRRRS